MRDPLVCQQQASPEAPNLFASPRSKTEGSKKIMAGENEPEVKDVETVHITPAEGDDDTILPEGTDPDSSPENEGEGDDESNKPDELVTAKKPAPTGEKKPEGDDGLKNVDGETPRERALRAEVTRLKDANRKERGDEVFGQPRAATPTKELSEDDKKVLGKYRPEEIGALKEVLPVLAKEMGYVRADELAGASYAEKAQETLDGFLDKHPEYLPENDKDGTLWNAFKAEYLLFKQPLNPKDFTKIFERIHRDVFNIKPAGALPKVSAQQEKTRVASHAGASSQGAAPRDRATKPAALDFRTDMLKGFSDEEKAEMFGE